MSQHTPTPLYYYASDGFIRSTEAPAPGCDLAPALCKPASHGTADEKVERREFIVRACNSHDALVKALEALHIEMDAFRQKAEVSDNTKRHWAKDCDQARAALALAKD